MLKKAIFSLGAVVLALGVLVWAADGLGGASPSRPQFKPSNFILTRSDGTHFSFRAELAQSEEEQAYGLMFLTKMPTDKGMIFSYFPPREVAFWMKNTLIPLDMIFVRPNGTIGRIVARAKPEDMVPISSQEPVIAVIEVNGGVASRDGLAVGDKVESPDIKVTQ